MNKPSSGDVPSRPDAEFSQANISPPFFSYHPDTRSATKNQAPNETSGAQQDRVIDWRYRTSRYFLEDQLRSSEAAQDFKSVKKLLTTLVRLSLRASYEFSPVVLEVPPSNR